MQNLILEKTVILEMLTKGIDDYLIQWVYNRIMNLSECYNLENPFLHKGNILNISDYYNLGWTKRDIVNFFILYLS